MRAVEIRHSLLKSRLTLPELRLVSYTPLRYTYTLGTYRTRRTKNKWSVCSCIFSCTVEYRCMSVPGSFQQSTDTSFGWVQSPDPQPTWRQLPMSVSDPLQCKSSSQIGPVPGPKARLKARPVSNLEKTETDTITLKEYRLHSLINAISNAHLLPHISVPRFWPFGATWCHLSRDLTTDVRDRAYH